MGSPTCAAHVYKQHSDVITGELSAGARLGQDGGHRHPARVGQGVIPNAQGNIRKMDRVERHATVTDATQRAEGVQEPACGWLSPSPPPNDPPEEPPETHQLPQHATHPHTSTSVHLQQAAATAPDFRRIRKVCAKGNYETANIDLRPIAFAEHRRKEWPRAAGGTLSTGLIRIYDTVRATGLPNAMGARQEVPTALNLPAWEVCLSDIGGRPLLYDFLRFGFPLGYVGPVSDSQWVDNHPSATDYPRQVQEFIDKESELGGLFGPFNSPPFTPWCHVSPLMSRPKAKEGDRRIITDMTFPHEVSVNAYIVKNGLYGIEMEHSLPTVDSLVQYIRHGDKGVYLATLDISRAYKNFTSDPLDWPLLCLAWGGRYFCDVSLPFGARASSFHMQSVANAIVDILAHKGIKAFMYLDDIILVSPNRHKALHDYSQARELLQLLALPEACDKSQPPAQRVKWLGIIIDTNEMTLTIPEDKLQQVLAQVSKHSKARSMSQKQLRSMLGHLLHVAKCVRPARLFVARLLEALREAKGWHIRVDANMRADFAWLLEFCGQWNGRSCIPDPEPAMHIYVDACLSGVGATDGNRAYAGQVAPVDDGADNITELEALNVIIALHSFLGKDNAKTHVQVHCDNKAAVQVLQSGRGRNKVLLDCARAAWMVQAVLDVQVSYVHVPGKDNEIADRLSRAHLSTADYKSAKSIIATNCLDMIDPCIFITHNLPAPLSSRSGNRLFAGQGSGQAETVKGPGHLGQSGVNSQDLRGIRQEGGVPPAQSQPLHGLRVHRVPGNADPRSKHDQEQGLSCEVLPPDGRGPDARHQPCMRQQGPRRHTEEQGLPVTGKSSGLNGHDKVGGTYYTSHTRGRGDKGRADDPVSGGTPTVGDCPAFGGKIRLSTTPYKRGLNYQSTSSHVENQMGKEHAEGWAGESGPARADGRPAHLPGYPAPAAFRPHPLSLMHRPTFHVPKVARPHTPVSDKGSMGICPPYSRNRHCKTVPAQPQKGGGHSGPSTGLWRHANTKTRRMEIHSFQSIH